MAIWGGDGSTEDNTAYADTWEDFIELWTSNCMHIGFPVEDQNNNPILLENRVIDLRKKGWLTTSYYSGGTKYVHGNNWTILGGSISSCFLFRISEDDSCRFMDLTFKNFYIISISSYAGLFKTSYCYTKEFYRCKISATIDTAGGIGSYTSGLINGGTNTNTDTVSFYQCSLNLKLHGSSYIRGGRNAYLYLENSIMNITTSEYGFWPTNNDLYFQDLTMCRFSKITGNLKLGRWSWSTGEFRVMNLLYSVYSVIDLEISKAPTVGSLSCRFNNGGYNGVASFIINKTKAEKNGFTLYSTDTSRIVPTDEVNMTNKAYLESVYFLVGDEPIDD